ncbi:Trk-type K+ transport system, membrane component [Methanolobus tindarius DSM 2278]|jgi:trk system potassium uptake protein TrkH|uniref:Trk-type K+ transport system, membrane component n=1 Tax=Methanolobus tindarius DSM 2278 TaxID=1090322 RepID=W9DXB1_METTI|nr:TrkH family potassium uptake protein [Methanolobus tindarius]ETA68337.1 Trk-type K+ transport system, membrane component [Methanolobus tindarius DSM 2278]
MYELHTPVHIKAVAKYMGYYLLAFSFVLVVPMIVAIIFHNFQATGYYGVTAIAAFVLGSFIYRTLPDYELETKEALIIVALVFPISAFLSAIPMSLSTGMPFFDAYFESVSAVTTTGLSVAPADVGPVFFFARSWGQWVGGIGIILIVLSVLIRPGTTAFRMYKANYGDMKIKPTVISTTRTLGKVYVVITLVSIVLLLLSGMSLFDSICHAFCCVSTGGFSTQTASIGAYNGNLIPTAISISCILGAISFVLYPYLLKKPQKFIRDKELKYFLSVLVFGSIVFALTLSRENFEYAAIKDNLFQIISAITTAGFSTFDLSILSEASKAVLIFIMWIGGCMGSTAGGIKVFRLLLLFKVVHNVLVRLFLPRETITPIKIEEHIIESEEIYNLVTFMLLYTLILVASAFIFMLYGVDTITSVFEASSALSTVGLSAGATSAAMPAMLKAVLIVDMLFGRIEIIPLILLFMPGTWIKRKRKTKRIVRT